MPKVYKVSKSRKPHTCGRCGRIINVGEGYYYAEPRYGPKVVRCLSHYPRPSELTTSEKLSILYGVEEEIRDIAFDPSGYSLDSLKDKLEEVISTLEELAPQVTTVGEEYYQSADNQEEYFPGSPTIDEIREKADNCEAFASSIESAISDLKELLEELSYLEEPLPPKVDGFSSKQEYLDAQLEYECELSELESQVDEIASEAESVISTLESEIP